MKRHQFLFLCIGLELSIILFIACANWMARDVLYAFFYNAGYGLLISVALPLIYAHRHAEPLSDFGFKRFGGRQIFVLLAFVAFSIGGQLIPLIIAGEEIRFHLFPLCAAPLLMTTFFEEFLFRGFMQTRLERQYGPIPAILLSGLFFSLYHLGYPGFRRMQDLALLFAVGVGFALAYKLSGNNLYVSFFVNLPNAYLTYLLKAEQFPTFKPVTTLYACLTILVLPIPFLLFTRKRPSHS